MAAVLSISAPFARVREYLSFVRLATTRQRKLGPPPRDLMQQARRLHAAGYHHASMIMARVVIELLLREMVDDLPDWDGETARTPMSAMSLHLQNGGLITEVTHKQIKNWTGKVNRAAHGKFIGGHKRAAMLLAQAETIHRSLLKGGAV